MKLLCKLLHVSRSGYYEFIKRPSSNTAHRHAYLTSEIKRVFDQHKGRYGSPRITLQLYLEGIETNKRVVAMLMQRAGLVRIYSRKRRKRYKQSSKENLLRVNLLNRSFDCDTPGSIFVTDITYVPCSDGTLYLTTFLDMATPMPKAYGITNHMRKECVTEPLKRLIQRGIEEGAIIHSDQGSQ